MIQEFVDRVMEAEDELKEWVVEEEPKDWSRLVQKVIETINPDHQEHWSDGPDPERIHEIDDGDWQGTKLFLIANDTYHRWKRSERNILATYIEYCSGKEI